MSLKILGCGDVSGNFTAFFKRLENVQKKAGPFEMVVCVGSFFGKDKSIPDRDKSKDTPQDKDVVTWNEYLSGKKRVPIPVYILGPNTQAECQNFTDLGG